MRDKLIELVKNKSVADVAVYWTADFDHPDGGWWHASIDYCEDPEQWNVHGETIESEIHNDPEAALDDALSKVFGPTCECNNCHLLPDTIMELNQYVVDHVLGKRGPMVETICQQHRMYLKARGDFERRKAKTLTVSGDEDDPDNPNRSDAVATWNGFDDDDDAADIHG